MWIRRDIEPLILRRAAERPALVLSGARQTGKTSLVKRLFPNHAFVSLDLPSEAEQAEKDPAAFLRRHPAPLVVDEVQYAPGLFRHLKSVIDSRRDERGLFILTGSQPFALMRNVTESLAGRADVLQLEPLTWREVRAVHPDVTIEEYLLRGGLPELHQDSSIEATAFHRSYTATYLERDLRQLLDVASLRDYERFLRVCGLRTAQLLNKADLARDVGISPSTAGAWISVLETSGLVALLEPWFSNRNKSLVKSPKLYLGDTGLACFLVGIHSRDQLLASPLAGALWETAVFAELRRAQLNASGGWELNFWRDRSREADFLRHRGGRFDIADAKWTAHPEARDAGSLLKLAAELPRNTIGRMDLVCRSTNPFPVDASVTALPLEEAAALWST